MQQTTSVAVLATHLAHTDRRALSQAWYSALHLADHAPPPRARPAASRPPGESAQRGAPHGGDSDSPESAADAARAARAADAARAGVAARADSVRAAGSGRGRDERAAACAAHAIASRDAGNCAPERSTSAELAHRTGRQDAQRPVQAAAASFTVQAADGRVHLLVRSDGTGTRVVAVCASSLRERVERALAHVRFTLAGAGKRFTLADAGSRVTLADSGTRITPSDADKRVMPVTAGVRFTSAGTRGRAEAAA